MTDVGAAHISHIETGMTLLGTKPLVQMINTLDCDPAEAKRAKSAGKTRWQACLPLSIDGNEDEIKIITDTVAARKASLHRNRSEDK